MAQKQPHRRQPADHQPVEPQRGRRPAQRKAPSAQRPTGEGGRRRPAHAAPNAHATPVRRPAARRRSSLPIVIISAVTVMIAGALTFFVLRSCVSGGDTGTQDAGQNGAAADGQAGGTADAATGKARDGSVDINLLMVGDILFHYQVRQSGLKDDGTRNYDHVYAHVLDELKDFDIKVLNQETPLGGNVYTGTAPDGYDGYPEFNGPQEMGDAEAKAGFNVALKATNHAMDNSGNFDDPYTLVKSEQEFWTKKHPEMNVIGEAILSDSNSTADDVYVYEKDGFKVALLNYTQDLNGNESHDRQGVVSMLEEEHVKNTMAKARELADMIVVFPHWGEEYNLEPVEMQHEWAKTFIDEGADVIIGNHPHVIEPVVALEGKDGKKVPCYWSTGNFVSTSPSNESLVGGIAEVKLHKDKDGNCSVTSAQFKPIISHLGLSTDMTTYLVSDWTDELAASNWLNTTVNPNTDNTSLTPAWAHEFCAGVLGSGYDPKTGVFDLKL